MIISTYACLYLWYVNPSKNFYTVLLLDLWIILYYFKDVANFNITTIGIINA